MVSSQRNFRSVTRETAEAFYAQPFGSRIMFYYGVSHKELDEYATALLDDPNNVSGEPPAERIIEFYKHDYEGILELSEQSLWSEAEPLSEEDDTFLIGPWYHELRSSMQEFV